MSYGVRRRIATVLAAVAAGGLTALGAWALGGHAPNPDSAGRAAVRPDRTVTRSITVRRVVRATSAPTPAVRVRVRHVRGAAAPAARYVSAHRRTTTTTPATT